MIDIGIRIKDKRLGRGYASAEKFAFDKGLNRTSYCLWERTGKMTIDNFFRVCKALDVEPSELVSKDFKFENIRFRK